MEGAVAGDHGDWSGVSCRRVRKAKRSVPTTTKQGCREMVGTALRAPLPALRHPFYLTTPDVNPAFRRGGLISFFRKQRASRPV
jgi:hypothetical protein